MQTFEKVFEKAQSAAFRSIGLPSRHDGANIFKDLVEEASNAIADSLPDPSMVSPRWTKTMTEARPELLKMPGGRGTAQQRLINAMADLILNEIEDDLREHARSKGFRIPEVPKP